MLKRFSQISASDIATCGGKGASLGELTQAGFPVPQGFVLTTSAFGTDVHHWDDAVLHAFDQLNCKFVAVRSSGTKEDGSEDSFAGQFDTYLFVSKEKLIEQILECHASVKSDRILAYCKSKNINPDDIKVAVVVQKMVNSESAGVCFTANPVSGARDEVMIEAGFGLGEAVVSGMITPDNYVVKKGDNSENISCRDGSINRPNNKNHISDANENHIFDTNENHISDAFKQTNSNAFGKINSDALTVRPYDNIIKHLSTQTKKITLDIEKGGTKEEIIESTLANVQKLSDEHIAQLAVSAVKIEKHYGKPMDIERAVENGELFILQARPITTLGEENEKSENNDVFHTFLEKTKHVERDVQRFNAYPFFISSTATVSGFDLPWGLKYTHFFCISHQDNVQWHYDTSDYMKLGNIFWEKVKTSEDILQLIKKYNERYDKAKQGYIYYDKILTTDSTLDFSSIKLALKAIVNEMAMAAGYAHIVEAARDVGEKLLKQQIGETTVLPMEVSFLTQAQQEAIQLKKSYPIEKAYQLFMEKYAWIKNSYLGITDITVEDFIEFSNHQIEDVSLPHYEKNSLLERLSLLFSWQDTRKAHILQSIHRADMLLKKIAAVFHIDRQSLYFMLPEEIEEIDKEWYRNQLIQRKEIFVDYTSSDGLRITLTDGEAYNFQKQREESKSIMFGEELHGNSGYTGKVKGNVRICLNLESIKSFQEGEILVASMTRPEYIGAMKKAVAIITDEGGITCHAAIVARELKKPCIIGTKIATQVLKDGDFVEVDADEGVVRILEQIEPITTLEKEKTYEGGNLSFQEIVERATVLTARASSLQRELFFGGYYRNNNFCSILFIITLLKLGTDIEWYIDDITSENFFKAIAKEFFMPGFLKEYIQRDTEHYPQFHKVYYQIYKDFTKKPVFINDKVVQDVKALYEYSLQDKSYYYFGLSTWAFDTKVVPQFKETLQGYFQGDFDAVWEKITAQTEITSEQKLRVELAKLKQNYGAKVPQKKIQEIQLTYQYLGKYCPEDEGYVYEDIVKLYNEIELEKVLCIPQEIAENKKQFKKLLQLYKKEKRICEIMSLINYNVYFRTIRMEKILQGFAYLSPMYEYLMEKLQFSRTEVGNLTDKEIIHFLKDGNIPKKRTVHPGMLYLPNETRELTEQEKEMLYRKFQVQTNIVEFTGNIAYQGKIQGNVKIVASKDDLSKIKEGDILVSQFTRPEYLLAMQKSSAFITNDGGITCHAAIVARELKKPCIIGTKIATQVLKDGDLVEVDADAGVVRILEQSGVGHIEEQEKNIEGPMIDFIKQLDHYTWIKKSLQGYFHLMFPFIKATIFVPTTKGYDYSIQPMFTFTSNNGIATTYENSEILNQVREDFFQQVKDNPNYFKEVKQQFYKAAIEYEKVLAEIDTLDFDQLSNEMLAQRYDTFFEKYVNEYKWYTTLGEAISQLATEYIHPIFQKKLGEKFDVVFPILTHPSTSSFLEEETQDRKILIQEYWEKGIVDDELEVKIKKHTDTYFYLMNNYVKGIKLTTDYFIDQIIQSTDTGEITDEKNLKKLKEKYLTTYNFSDEESFLLKIVNEFFKLIDDRKKNMMKASYYQIRFLEEAEKRTNLPFEILKRSIQPEYSAILQGTFPLSVLEERARNGAFVHIHNDLSYDIITGKSYQSVEEYFEKKFEVNQTTTSLKGMSASSGTVQGKVKIVLRIEDIEKVNEGDILVASMTRPEMIVAMQKASAFITDEGGITCHAAIVARELKKPCIIGTKIATQVLKDGDLVEVDADAGVVRILEQTRPITTLGEIKENGEVYKNNQTVRKFYEIMEDSELYPPISTSLSSIISVGNIHKYYQIPISNMGFSINDDNKFTIFFSMTTFRNIAMDGFKKYFVENKKQLELVKKMKTLGKQSMNEYDKIFNVIESTALSMGKLKQKLMKFINIENEYNAISLFAYYFDKELCWELIQKYNIQISQVRFDAIWDTLSKSYVLSIDKRRRLDILGLLYQGLSLTEIKKKRGFYTQDYNGLISDEKFENYFSEYTYLKKEEIIKEMQEIEHYQKTLKDKRKNIKNQLQSEVERNLFDYLQMIIEIRDERKDIMFAAIFLRYLYYKKIALVNDLTTKDLEYLMLFDIDDTTGKLLLSKADLQTRSIGFVYLMLSNGEVLYEDVHNSEQLMTAINNDFYEKKAPDNKLSGQIGYTGYVQGKVKLIISTDDFKKFQEGEILVTGMTRPEFVPLMKKAGAIITNEGGITCHAAIIARELKKPCIIGTKIATQVLKDGDFVEVDADAGVVRILEQVKPIMTLEKKEITSDLIQYFERKCPIYLSSISLLSHFSQLKSLSGIGFNKTMLVYKNDSSFIYFSENELREVNKHFLRLIKNNDERLDKWYIDGIHMNTTADILIKQYSLNKPIDIKEYKKVLKIVIDTFLYSTIVPHFILASVNYALENGEEREKFTLILNKFEALRKETRYPQLMQSVVLKFFQKVSELFGLELSLIEMMTPWEIERLFVEKYLVSSQELLKRKEFCYALIEEGKIKFAFNKQDIKFLGKHIDTNVKILEGKIANKGFAKGKVKIVNTIDDMKKFNKGEIVISINTNPSLLPILREANAIITDEGGIMCHAAIVSRELKKPCIIGTKIATQVLKDGDLVEVDANEGVVRILS